MTQGICPVCSGSGRMPVSPEQQRYKHVYSGYDSNTDTLRCTNCGGQYMFGRSSGKVNLDKQGAPCKHSYTSSNAGRCLTNYDCVHCGDHYQIDSGDWWRLFQLNVGVGQYTTLILSWPKACLALQAHKPTDDGSIATTIKICIKIGAEKDVEYR